MQTFKSISRRNELRNIEAKKHGILKVTGILRHYGTKMFRVRGEKAVMQLRSQAAKLKLSRVHNDSHGKISPNPLPVKNLFPYSPIHLLPSKKVAFTLAETLITLGIIGVVAALTLPSVIEKHKEHVTVTKVKKFYNLLSQNYLFAVREYGTPDEWGISGRDRGSSNDEEETYTAQNAILVRDRLFKNSKILKTCNNAKDQKACGISDAIYEMNGTKNKAISGANAQTASLRLVDGSSVLVIANGSGLTNRGLGALSETYAIIYLDINGVKEPNTYGKDFFMFYLTKTNITPTGTQNEYWWTFPTCYTAGGACTAWVVINGNMDYLHCSGLNWNGNSKCK